MADTVPPASCACGARLAGAATHCSLCHSPSHSHGTGPAAEHDGPLGLNGFSTVAPQAVRMRVSGRRSRVRRTSTTFGPVGRVVATVLLVLPLGVFAFAGAFGVIGFLMWTFLVLPLALRDVWRSERLPGVAGADGLPR